MTQTRTSADIAEYEDLLRRYCSAIDDRNLTLLDEIIEDDIVIARPVGDLVGRAQVLDFYREKFTTDPNLQRHVARDVVVADGAEPTETTVTSLFSSAAVTPEGPIILFMGNYRDVVRRTDAGLRLVRKQIEFKTTRIEDLDD